VNDLGDSKALDALYSALKHCGRYQIVQEREKADLLIVMTENEQYAGFVTTANVTSSGTSAHGTGMAIPIQGRKFFLRLLDGTSGESLWTESRLMYWTPSKTAKLLVERIRKRAEGKQYMARVVIPCPWANHRTQQGSVTGQVRRTEILWYADFPSDPPIEQCTLPATACWGTPQLSSIPPPKSEIGPHTLGQTWKVHIVLDLILRLLPSTLF
jgi:hypothetical protein